MVDTMVLLAFPASIPGFQKNNNGDETWSATIGTRGERYGYGGVLHVGHAQRGAGEAAEGGGADCVQPQLGHVKGVLPVGHLYQVNLPLFVKLL